MNYSARPSDTKYAKQVIARAIVAGFLLVLPSCGIPPLNQAQQTPPLPDTFKGAPGDENSANGATSGYSDENSGNGATSDEASALQDGDVPPLPSPQDDAGDADSADGATSVENSARLQWDEFFEDPMLVSLIDQALIGNQELRILGQEVQIARYEIQARRGELLPFLTFGGHADLEKPSRFTRMGAVEEALEVAPERGFPEPLPDFLAAANFSWQIDIWRQLRNARDAAILRFFGTREGRNYAATRLVAEVAENYYELMALDSQLATLDNTIAIQQQSLEVAKNKKAAGRGTELAVQRFQAAIRKNQSRKSLIQQQIVQVENHINFLLGRYPQPIDRASAQFLDREPPSLSVGVPAELLQNRPDIREAERKLAAAGLDVQVARANFYPRLEILSGVGLNAFNPEFFFSTPESLIYNAAVDVAAPLINRAAIRAEYQSANAEQLRAVYDYQRVVLKAYREVVTRLAKVQNFGESVERKRQQLQALDASVEVATQLFQAARAEYIEVLLAQRDRQEARMELIETKQQQLAAVVNLYQALGGGGSVPGLPEMHPSQQPFKNRLLQPFENLHPDLRPLFADSNPFRDFHPFETVFEWFD